MSDPLTLGLMAAGTLFQAAGSIGSGMAQKKAAKFEARQMEAQAKAETAAGSRQAMEEARQKRLQLSRAQLVGASSGGGRAWGIEGDIEEDGQYRALTALWDGGERATAYRTQATARRYDGRAAKRAGFIGGMGSLAQGAARMTIHAKYSGKKP